MRALLWNFRRAPALRLPTDLAGCGLYTASSVRRSADLSRLMGRRGAGSRFPKLAPGTDLRGTAVRSLVLWWDRFWFDGGSAVQLALLPIVTAVVSLSVLLSRYPGATSGFPPDFWIF